jgi:hypothetical protein
MSNITELQLSTDRIQEPNFPLCVTHYRNYSLVYVVDIMLRI